MHKQVCDCGCGVALKQLATRVEDAALRLHMERVTDSGRSWWEDMWHSHFVIHRDSPAFKILLVHVAVWGFETLAFFTMPFYWKRASEDIFPQYRTTGYFEMDLKINARRIASIFLCVSKWIRHLKNVHSQSNVRYNQLWHLRFLKPWYAPTMTGSSLLSEHTQTHWYSYRHQQMGVQYVMFLMTRLLLSLKVRDSDIWRTTGKMLSTVQQI